MGLKINGILIDPDEPKKIVQIPDEEIGENKIVSKPANLSPKNLRIGFYRERIVILNEAIVEYVLSEDEELHRIEQAIVIEYPNAGLIHVHQFDTIGFIGYCYIAEQKKQRTKAVADGKLYLDQGIVFESESVYAEMLINSLKKSKPKYLENTLKNFEDLSKNDQIKEFLLLRETILKDGSMGYYNGGIDEEVMHKFISSFTDTDWTRLTELDYVEYQGVSAKNKELNILKYINHAYSKLKEKTDNMR